MTTTATDHTMRAVLHDRYGTSGVLHLGRVAIPVIGDHDVLVDVRAAGLDRGTEPSDGSATGLPRTARQRRPHAPRRWSRHLDLERRTRQPARSRLVAGAIERLPSDSSAGNHFAACTDMALSRRRVGQSCRPAAGWRV